MSDEDSQACTPASSSLRHPCCLHPMACPGRLCTAPTASRLFPPSASPRQGYCLPLERCEVRQLHHLHGHLLRWDSSSTYARIFSSPRQPFLIGFHSHSPGSRYLHSYLPDRDTETILLLTGAQARGLCRSGGSCACGATSPSTISQNPVIWAAAKPEGPLLCIYNLFVGSKYWTFSFI